MRLNKRLESYQNYILVHEFDYNAWFKTNGEELSPNELLDPYGINASNYNPDKINPNTGMVEGCYRVLERQEWIVDGIFGETYDNFYLIDLGNMKLVISSLSYHSPDIEEVWEAPQQKKKEEPKEEKNYIIKEPQELGNTTNSNFQQTVVQREVKEPTPEQIIINEMKEKRALSKKKREEEYEKMKEKAKSLKIPFNILHPKVPYEKTFKLMLHNELYWEVWVGNVKFNNKEYFFRKWCDGVRGDLNKQNPLEYAYLQVRDYGKSEEEVIEEIKELLKKDIGL